ncbi:hypothetical protein L0F51_13015 [Afifella sp. H1R]|uniref:hypothetical protein n=1 Tax=Afifella sp. H1R TaxID=2908841 RepID=UPI001F47D74E|nr:hypothetical protein [Afifella sp. H1R]MCF1504670.1 hypothetical protein [Afifella sp. H1R]
MRQLVYEGSMRGAKPDKNEARDAARKAREQRLAEALRANLKRRKDKARAASDGSAADRSADAVSDKT